MYRLVECTQGQVPLEVIFEPRLNYARGDTLITVSRHGVTASQAEEAMTLSASTLFAPEGDRAVSRFTMRQGETAQYVLRHAAREPRYPRTHNPQGKLDKTRAYWEAKADSCVFTGPWRDAIVRSYLALHLMIYSPTGAIIAAPTTSLPERIGGERNWDYRFTWLRDASLTLFALFRLGHGDEARGFMKWLMTVCDKCGPKAQILYDIDFENPLPEQVLGHLKGYRDSRPVRIGNDAYRQRQLDVYGEVLDAAYSYLKIGGRLTRRTWGVLETFADAACELWPQPDSGIWEIRGGPYHFVHSKMMCWVAVDRGIKIAEAIGRRRKLRTWRKVAQAIRDDILAKGWNAEKRAFTQHYDTTALDASNLLIPIYGFLPVSDERVASTIERTMEELSWNGLLRRYNTDETDDGLSGTEGAFLWCSFWLVRDLLKMGRRDDARALYERLLSYRNHLGLLSEMVDPTSGEVLGNFPQALTHLAVITAGLDLTDALDKRDT